MLVTVVQSYDYLLRMENFKGGFIGGEGKGPSLAGQTTLILTGPLKPRPVSLLSLTGRGYIGAAGGKRLFLLPYYRKAITQGDDDLLDARVGGYVVVEAAYALGLVVVVVGWVGDVAVPKGVVGEDVATGAQD